MKCTKCGATIKEGKLFCSVCGQEIRIVPDYNDLEEEILNEILENEDLKENGRTTSNRGSVSNTSNRTAATFDKKNHTHHAPEKKIKKLQKWIIFCSIVSSIAVIIIILVVYYNMTTSYTYLYNKAITYENNEQYTKAIDYYKKAISKNEKSLDARFSLADIYKIQKKDSAEIRVLLNIVSIDKTNKQAFEALIAVYNGNDDYDAIQNLYKMATTSGIKDLFTPYLVSKPVFDQDAGAYSKAINIKLTSPDKDEIYYTTDGSDPKESGELYEDPIPLTTDGSYKIKAVCKNARGAYSELVTEEFDITLSDTASTEQDLVVTPVSGTYAAPQTISITVPEGYRIYYTWDGSTPTTDSSLYTQALNMPSGNTILSIIYVDLDGNVSAVSRYNYICN